MDKYIFLDIDGVIATDESLYEAGFWGLVSSKQDLLGGILDATGAKIVLSSSWRKSTLEDTIVYMNEQGFRFGDKIVGVTIRAYHYIQRGIHLSIPRGVEIKQWIDTHVHSDGGKNWDRKVYGVDYTYVILDDDTDILLEQKDNFIPVDSSIGLTYIQALTAIQVLNKVLPD